MSKTNAGKTGFTFEEVCLSFIEKCRFYTVILSKINKVPFNGVPTAGVGFNKHGKLTMFYNPKFVAKLPLAEAQGLVEHECCHIVYRHLSRFPMKNTVAEGIKGMKDLTPEKIKGIIKEQHDNKINNWGTDMAINQYIDVLPKWQKDDQPVILGQVQAGENMGLYPETHNLPRELAAEFYVSELKKLFPKPPEMPQQECQTCGGTGKKQDKKDEDQDGQGEQKGKGKKEDQDQDGQGEQDEKGQDGQDGEGEGQQDDNQDGQGEGESEQQGQGGGHNHGDDGEPCPDCGGKGHHDAPSLDSHDLWGKVIEVDKDGNLVSMGDVQDNPDIDPEYECEAVVMKAIKECKDWGKIPAHIQREIDRMRTVKRHDWKRTLRIFINSVLTVAKRRTQKRVDRRLATIVEYLEPGKKKSRKPRVLYVRDTSGSMFSDAVQADINNELEQLAKRCDVYVCDADTKVHQTYRYRKASDMKPYKGGGGTSFVEAFKEAKKLGVDGIIYATDTYGDFPDTKDIRHFAKDTIWLTFGQATVNVPFGKHVNIDPAEYAEKKKYA